MRASIIVAAVAALTITALEAHATGRRITVAQIQDHCSNLGIEYNVQRIVQPSQRIVQREYYTAPIQRSVEYYTAPVQRSVEYYSAPVRRIERIETGYVAPQRVEKFVEVRQPYYRQQFSQAQRFRGKDVLFIEQRRQPIFQFEQTTVRGRRGGLLGLGLLGGRRSATRTAFSIGGFGGASFTQSSRIIGRGGTLRFRQSRRFRR